MFLSNKAVMSHHYDGPNEHIHGSVVVHARSDLISLWSHWQHAIQNDAGTNTPTAIHMVYDASGG